MNTTLAINPTLPTNPGTVDRRRYERQIYESATAPRAHRLRWRAAPLMVVDLSETGMTVESRNADEFKIGERFELRLSPIKDRNDAETVVRGVVRNRYADRAWGLQFDDLLKEQLEKQKFKHGRMMTVAMASLLAGIIVLLKARNVVSFWYGPLLQTYSLGAAIYILSRVVLSMCYRRPLDKGYLPKVSLIVAVKNEEDHIARTVEHCFGSRYPSDRLEVIVVDDGSTDNTWSVLTDIQQKNPKFRAFQFAVNRGKRHAMAKGIREASGDYLIFIDSDTFLEEEAIYRLVQPFHDPRVGAVAGHTHMIVEKDNLISKMESVRYYVSQRVIKAAESVFNAVTCCPGPLSGYRKSVILPILDKWENQTFLGTQATFGDDRSLTNFVLRNNRVVYHSGAGCWTYAPSKMKVFIRQQLRWKKSWLREFTIASRFMWKKHPIAALSYYASVIITLISPLVVFAAMFGFSLVGTSFNFWGYVTGLLLVYAFLGLVYRYHTNSRYWAYGLIFAVMYLFFFAFQNYYAMLTVRKNQWGTR